MRAQGNGAPAVCANNLLCIVRGEVPFERVKGLDPRLIDKPLSVAKQDIEADAELVIDAYEPRVQLQNVQITEVAADIGGLKISATVTEREE